MVSRIALLGIVATAIASAIGAGGALAQAPDFEKVQIVDDSLHPMSLEIAPDGRVFYIERFGRVRIWEPDTGETVDAATIPVHSERDNGLLGIALDPDFEQTNTVYLTYSVPPEETLTVRVSRFGVSGDTLELGSEEIIYEWQHQRHTNGHTAGHLDFGPDGSLYISTGDNTSPYESDGYAPIDERPDREGYDAQGTSANTNNPNGKILRIVPNEDGAGYEIPEGNMFEPGTEGALPEIYAMGFRNPFRFTVDPETGWVLMADYGPDAAFTNPQRGPQGSVEWNVVTEPGFYGWPYCIRENVPYVDYDFATGDSGMPFDCANPVNDSPYNTGLAELAAAQPASMWMGRTQADARFPGLGTGGAPMSGERYHYDPSNPLPTRFPASLDGHWFISEWGANWIKSVTLDGEGNPAQVHDFPLPGQLVRPGMDLEFGPDGSLYLIEWGSAFDGGNDNSGIYRIDYTGEPPANNPPIIEALTATPSEGDAPLAVEFAAEASDPDDDELTYDWELGDGGSSAEPDPTHVYASPGAYQATLTVSDGTDQVSESVSVLVNEPATASPDLRLTGRPPVRRVGPRRGQVRFLLLATNVGDASAEGVRLCARGPKRRIAINGKGCVTRAIAGGATTKHPVEVRIKPASRGRVTTIRLSARGPDIEERTARVRLRVRR
jgi:glucose/arabinose dehydrogenase